MHSKMSQRLPISQRLKPEPKAEGEAEQPSDGAEGARTSSILIDFKRTSGGGDVRGTTGTEDSEQEPGRFEISAAGGIAGDSAMGEQEDAKGLGRADTGSKGALSPVVLQRLLTCPREFLELEEQEEIDIINGDLRAINRLKTLVQGQNLPPGSIYQIIRNMTTVTMNPREYAAFSSKLRQFAEHDDDVKGERSNAAFARKTIAAARRVGGASQAPSKLTVPAEEDTITPERWKQFAAKVLADPATSASEERFIHVANVKFSHWNGERTCELPADEFIDAEENDPGITTAVTTETTTAGKDSVLKNGVDKLRSSSPKSRSKNTANLLTKNIQKVQAVSIRLLLRKIDVVEDDVRQKAFLEVKVVAVFLAFYVFSGILYSQIDDRSEQSAFAPDEFDTLADGSTVRDKNNLDWVSLVYTLVVTSTTVGYGDFSPKSGAARAVFIVWILFCFVIFSQVFDRVATLVGYFVDTVLDPCLRAPLQKIYSTLGWKRFALQQRVSTTVVVIVLIGLTLTIGALGFLALESDAQPELTLSDAYYFAMVTATTVGYGDLLPTRDETKMFVVFFLFCGISLIAYVFTLYEKVQHNRNKLRRMANLETFADMSPAMGALMRLKSHMTEIEFMFFALLDSGAIDMDEVHFLHENVWSRMDNITQHEHSGGKSIYSSVNWEGFRVGMAESFKRKPVMEKLSVNQKRCFARTGKYFTQATADERQAAFEKSRSIIAHLSRLCLSGKTAEEEKAKGEDARETRATTGSGQ
ncbi:unnamed protein product [Amoebophrya sp. A25]|nr:unnamed protein product [Amoebophrya sp. A25]|eukprot:GSA25T00000265001.1